MLRDLSKEWRVRSGARVGSDCETTQEVTTMPAHVKGGEKRLHSMEDVPGRLEGKVKGVSVLGMENHYSHYRRQTQH